MAVQDLWRDKNKKPTKRDGVGKRWRVVVDGHPTRAFHLKADATAWEAKLISQGSASARRRHSGRSARRLVPRREVTSQPAAAATRKRALQVLRGALEIAVKRGRLPANPCLGVDQLRKLADAAAEVGQDPDRVMVWLLGTCDPRISEATRLDVRDVDVKRRRLRVRKSENGLPRDVPLSAAVQAMA